MSQQVTSARETAEFYRHDPELALAIPAYPRLIPEVQILPFRENDLLFVGGCSIQVFKGNGAKRIITELQPYLNGQYSIADIEQRVPEILKPRVFEVVTLLANKGMLEDANADLDVDLDTPLASYIGRYLSHGRNFRSREESLQHIQDTRLAIVAPEAYLSHLKVLFAELPLASLTCSADPALLLEQDNDVHLIIEGPGFKCDQNLHLALKERDKAVFYASIFNESVSIGPLTAGGQGTSYDSFIGRIAPAKEDAADAPELLFWLGNLYHEFVNYLAKVSLRTVFNVCKHYHISDNELEGNTVKTPPMPGHKDGPLAHVGFLQNENAVALWELHNNIRMPPKTYIGDGFHLNHYKKSNRVLTKTSKPKYFSSVTYDLPPARPLPNGQLTEVNKALDMQGLADVLVYCYGYQVTPNGPRLIPPTGGGLSSPEAYLIVSNVDGIPEGTYHYDAEDHKLEFIGDVNLTMYASLLNVDQLPQCLLLGVASLSRIRAKYGDSAFKITNLDSGVAQTYLRKITTRLGLPLFDYIDWNGMGLMESAGIAYRENRFVLSHVFGLGQITPMVMHHDDMVNHFLAPKVKQAPSQWQENTFRRIYSAKQDLTEILLKRRAVREFSDKPVKADDVCRLLSMAERLASQIKPIHEVQADLNYWVVLRYASDNHPAGLYQYDKVDASLSPVNLDQSIDFTRFVNQSSLTEAGALVLATANLDVILNQHQAFGYKTMWQHAGQILGDLWLNAVAEGYVGTIAGGALDDGLMTYANTDGYTNAVLGLFCLGHPEETA